MGGDVNLKNDFEQAKAKVNELTQERVRRNQPYVNPDFILYDPYLHTHNRDIHAEYPNPVTDQEWTQKIPDEIYISMLKYLLAPEERKNVTKKDIQYALNDMFFNGKKKNSEIDQEKFSHLVESFNANAPSNVLSRANMDENETQKDRKQTLRKRLKRVLDALIQQKEKEVGDKDDAKIVAYATFGEMMGQLQGRCIDGVEEGVEYFEDGLVYADNGPMFTEFKVSKIITSDKHHFIKQHKAFAHDCAKIYNDQRVDEFSTGIPEMLLQRMRYALSLRGETHQLDSPG